MAAILGAEVVEETVAVVEITGARGGKVEDKKWILITKLGCLVKDVKIKSLKEIDLFSLPIKE